MEFVRVGFFLDDVEDHDGQGKVPCNIADNQWRHSRCTETGKEQSKRFCIFVPAVPRTIKLPHDESRTEAESYRDRLRNVT